MSQYLDDGHQTLISFAAAPSVKFKEKTVTPPGIDAGGEIDTTTMLNTTWRTRAPKALKTLTNAMLTVSYDPDVYPDIVDLVGVNNLITITFPDASTLAFWGFANKFTPGEMKEGEQPTAELEIVCSNMDASGDETTPVETPG